LTFRENLISSGWLPKTWSKFYVVPWVMFPCCSLVRSPSPKDGTDFT